MGFVSGGKGTNVLGVKQRVDELFEKKDRKRGEIALKRPQNWGKRHKKRATAGAPTLITLNLIL